MNTLTQPQQTPTTAYPTQPAILKVAPGLWYAGVCDGVLQFTIDQSEAVRITPEAFPGVVEACKKAGYGKGQQPADEPQTEISAYLTDPQVHQVAQGYRYMVKLFTKAVDYWGVPSDVSTLDVVVTDPTEAAVTELVRLFGWLTDWTIAAIWEPEDCSEF